jgi:tryptophan synthase alpha chain
MGRIAAVFARLDRPAFIAFTVAGDPDRETSIRAATALIDGGTDILELGIPFSDPVADGPTIQKADERSLAAGTKTGMVFDMVRTLREKTAVPIVLLVYCNMVLHRGIDRFYSEAHDAGVDGILIADMPVEESDEVYEAARRHGIDPIFLITQTTSDERIKAIAARAQGYLYLVAVLGVTGVRDEVSSGALELLGRVRNHSPLPLALGFGISTPSHAKICAEAGADGVIVGSAIVALVEKNLGSPETMVKELKAYVTRMKGAL